MEEAEGAEAGQALAGAGDQDVVQQKPVKGALILLFQGGFR